MKNLTDVSTWAAIVQCFKDSDMDLLNESNFTLFLQQLANRTKYLLDQSNAHNGASAPHTGHETPSGAQHKVNVHANVIVGAHGGTSNAWGSYPVSRDVAGRTKFVGGVASGDAVTFDQFGGVFSNPNGYKLIPGGGFFQWATGSGMTAEGSQTIPLYTSFPSAILFAVPYAYVVGGDSAQRNGFVHLESFPSAGAVTVNLQHAEYSSWGGATFYPRVFCFGV